MVSPEALANQSQADRLFVWWDILESIPAVAMELPSIVTTTGNDREGNTLTDKDLFAIGGDFDGFSMRTATA